MKITKKEIVPEINFEDVETGQVFKSGDGYYIALDRVVNSCGDFFNAVRIGEGGGVPAHFFDYDSVVDIDNAELIVNR